MGSSHLAIPATFPIQIILVKTFCLVKTLYENVRSFQLYKYLIYLIHYYLYIHQTITVIYLIHHYEYIHQTN